LYPENTIKGFLKAVDLGVTTLEMDVVITRDKKVLLSHEPFLSQEICYDSIGAEIPDSMALAYNLYQMTYEEISRCDCGSKPHGRFPDQVNNVSHKPLLKDVIRKVEAYTKENGLPPVSYNIETKCGPEGDDIYHPKPVEFVDLLMGVVGECGISSRLIVQSFDDRTLHYVMEAYPAITIALLIEDNPDFEANLEKFGSIPNIYSPNYLLVNKELMEFAGDNSMKVIPWTANDRTSMSALLELGVDGIITDYPNQLVDVLRIHQAN
jgi:glycerophosphoryl diester phosphodiesterase